MINHAKKRVAIIGGGIAGSTIAIRLAHLGLDVALFEKDVHLVSGPPMCHLHAGGNMYRELSDADCRTLLRQAIDTMRLFPHSIDKRPTVIAVPTMDPADPSDLLPRLSMLDSYYRELINQDAANELLSDANGAYYQTFSRAELERLALMDMPVVADRLGDWMVGFAKVVDLDALKFPVVCVNEYSWNLFALSASVTEYLAGYANVSTHLNTPVTHIAQISSETAAGWLIDYQMADGQIGQMTADFVVNATGFATGTFDDLAGVQIQRMVEFKAAYLARWMGANECAGGKRLPEMVFHGIRGTAQGMAQFSPYAGGYVQLHGMTPEITLFKDGLTYSTADSSQPVIKADYLTRISDGWDMDKLERRTQRAIDFTSRFVPDVVEASIYPQALYGAQQVPDDDISLRVGSVYLAIDKRYATVQNIKASSVLDIADKIADALSKLKLVPFSERPNTWASLDRQAVWAQAGRIALARKFDPLLAQIDYPLTLS